VNEQTLVELREQVLARSSRAGSFHHGERHWRAVARAGLDLVSQVPDCNPLVVFLFALFHDAQRENEFDDPEHGRRGGELAQELLLEKTSDATIEVVYRACLDHSHVERSSDPTIGVCWDADRLNLWRVGKKPDPRYLSTEPAREPKLIVRAAAWHDASPDWKELTRRYVTAFLR
jgi:uncharacterized protein